MLAGVALCATSYAQTFTYDSFNDTKKTCRITGYSGTITGTLTIPDTYTKSGVTYKVTTLQTEVFNDLPNVTAVKIGANMAKIGQVSSSDAGNGLKNFNNCPQLAKFIVDSSNTVFKTNGGGVLYSADLNYLYRIPEGYNPTDGLFTMSDNCTFVETHAFDNANNVKTIHLSKAMVGISDTAGYDLMESLVKFEIDSSNTQYETPSGVLINKFSKSLKCFPKNLNLKSFSIPTYVEEIDNNAFRNAKYLQTVTIPSAVKWICTRAFAGSALTSVTIPAGVQIGRLYPHAFENCKSLKSIHFLGNNPTMAEYLCAGCTALTKVSYDRGSNGEVSYVGKSAFKNCEKLTDFPMDGGIPILGDSAFYNTGFVDLIYAGLDGTGTVTGQYIFANSRNLKSVDMSAVGNYHLKGTYFYGCQNLTTFKCPKELYIYGAPFGYACNVNKIIGYNINCEKITTTQGFIYSGAGAPTPSLYLLTDGGKIKRPMVNPDKLFGRANGCTIRPKIYTEARQLQGDTDMENWISSNCAYYVPALSIDNFEGAPDVKEMFTVEMSNRNGKAEVRVKSHCDNVDMTYVTFNNVVGGAPNSDGILNINYDYNAVNNIQVTYVIDGDIKMSTTYDRYELPAVSDVDTIITDNLNDTEYFTLQGVKVTTPQPGALYIMKRGETATKIRL